MRNESELFGTRQAGEEPLQREPMDERYGEGFSPRGEAEFSPGPSLPRRWMARFLRRLWSRKTFKTMLWIAGVYWGVQIVAVLTTLEVYRREDANRARQVTAPSQALKSAASAKGADVDAADSQALLKEPESFQQQLNAQKRSIEPADSSARRLAEGSLLWTTGDNGSDVTWQEAKAYCENLTEGDSHQWELPSVTEIREILADSGVAPFKKKVWAKPSAGSSFLWTRDPYDTAGETHRSYRSYYRIFRPDAGFLSGDPLPRNMSEALFSGMPDDPGIRTGGRAVCVVHSYKEP